MSDQACKTPKRRFTINGYEFRSDHLLRYWECSAYGFGSSAHTPWTAWLRQRRWYREWKTNPSKYMMNDDE